MKKMIQIIASLATAIGFLLIGVIIGAYYHNELIVLYDLYANNDNNVLSPSPAPVDLTTTSALILPSLTEPLPLVYSETLEEEIVQQQLKKGAVVLPLGTTFGEPGNVVVTAHSSGTEAFGPYRFAFAKLSELEEGAEYSIKTPKAEYRYRVYGKEIVWPHEVDRLPDDDRSTVTLVTCWPLWTNFKRLLVHSELVSVQYNL